ncbi:iron complex transport system substrate-binding protein [Marinospirillum alkaliphilum DSM 21637]|uniref:Iron complex transport system substrate-binding protein n=2 Tax=Marinospirillum TaxID=64968 RepID=A0A1K1XJQ7_9GAMM|nr:iron complex transport system substrate-binding protein [Marinospirillum alkaliphilum DSM 21637]
MCLVFLALLLMPLSSFAQSIQVTDDTGRTLQLAQPAQRLISLAPHITENVFAAGAGDLLIAAVKFSDYPEAATHLPRVGSHTQMDLEGIVALQPDLILAWHSGNPRAQLEQLERLGIPIYYSEPRSFAEVAENLRRIGTLTGHQATAELAATELEQGVAAVKTAHQGLRPVRVFYQVWEQPLMTINREHIIHEAISLCGGENIFADVDALIPRISQEAVIQQNPEAILGGGMGEANRAWLDNWQRFESLQAVQDNKLYFIPPSLLQRATPRMLEGTRLVCEKLQQARGH